MIRPAVCSSLCMLACRRSRSLTDVHAAARVVFIEKGLRVCLPVAQVFMLPSDAVLDEATLFKILDSGHSRVPIYRVGNRCAGQLLSAPYPFLLLLLGIAPLSCFQELSFPNRCIASPHGACCLQELQ